MLFPVSRRQLGAAVSPSPSLTPLIPSAVESDVVNEFARTKEKVSLGDKGHKSVLTCKGSEFNQLVGISTMI